MDYFPTTHDRLGRFAVPALLSALVLSGCLAAECETRGDYPAHENIFRRAVFYVGGSDFPKRLFARIEGALPKDRTPSAIVALLAQHGAVCNPSRDAFVCHRRWYDAGGMWPSPKEYRYYEAQVVVGRGTGRTTTLSACIVNELCFAGERRGPLRYCANTEMQ